MDGTLGSGTASMLDGSGVGSRVASELAEIVLARRRSRLSGRRARDRRPRQPRGARRVRGDARRSGRRSGCARASSTRSCSRPPTCPASRNSGSPARCSSRTPPRIATSPTASGRGRPRAPTPTARCGLRRAGRQRLRRPDRGARSARRDPRGRTAERRRTRGPGIPSRRSAVEQAFAATTVTPAWLDGRGALAGKAPARVCRRPRRARPRPVGRPRRRGRRDDGRRALGAQPPALGLSAARRRRQPMQAPAYSAASPRKSSRAAAIPSGT